MNITGICRIPGWSKSGLLSLALISGLTLILRIACSSDSGLCTLSYLLGKALYYPAGLLIRPLVLGIATFLGLRQMAPDLYGGPRTIGEIIFILNIILYSAYWFGLGVLFWWLWRVMSRHVGRSGVGQRPSQG
jgi:hypothetical protein